MNNTSTSKLLSGRAPGAALPQRQAAVPASSTLRQFKVLQPGHSPAQLSLFLRPAVAR